MPRLPKFQVRQTPSGWMINVPASLTETGKRERHFHKTRDKAKSHAAELREKFQEHGSAAAAIKPSLAEDAIRAASLLVPWELTLTEAARRVAAQMERESSSTTLEKASSAWLQSMDGLRERSIKSYELTITRMKAHLAGRLMATITAEDITLSIRHSGLSTATVALHRRNARAFWYWCARQGWCDREVFDRVDSPRKPSDKEIEFLSPEQVETLLRTAQNHYPQAVPMYAVALFAGVRAEELKRLDSQHFNDEGISLPADVTKKGRRRHITLNDTLREWLKAYPFKPCPNWKKIDNAVRRLAGWDVSSPLLQNPPTPIRGKWPQNALRHTHATYAIASGITLDTLLFEFGHAGGVEVLRKHYVGRATKTQAERFYSIHPK